jgi:predicted RNA-binding Zn-ribbon protein involved in translation (DUF1610 family)
MKCKVCKSEDIQFVSKWSNTENEYGCINCGQTIITRPENEDKQGDYMQLTYGQWIKLILACYLALC